MATTQQKKQAVDYLAAKLEESGLYDIQRLENNHSLFVRETTQFASTPKTYQILIPNFLARLDNCKQHLHKNNQEGIYTAPVFYKDGKTAFALLQHTPTFWNHDQTLKNYTADQKHSILNLRDMERYILEQFGNDIAYYQPETAHLKESIRVFTLDNVNLDYSHILPEDPLYNRVHNRISLDYKLPLEKQTLGPTIALEPISEQNFHKKAKVIFYDNTVEENTDTPFPFPQRISSVSLELFNAARRAYPDLPPKDAYKLYCGQEE